MSKLGVCESCGRDIFSIRDGDISPDSAAVVELSNSVPVISGGCNSVLSGKTCFVKDVEFSELLKSKLTDSQKDLYICDDCLIRFNGTRFLWFGDSNNSLNTAKSVNTATSDTYIAVQRKCTAYKYNTDKDRIYDLLSSDESFLHLTRNGLHVDRYITKNPDNLLIVSRIDNAKSGLEITEVRKDQVLVLYSVDDFEVISEEEFNKKFVQE